MRRLDCRRRSGQLDDHHGLGRSGSLAEPGTSTAPPPCNPRGPFWAAHRTERREGTVALVGIGYAVLAVLDQLRGQQRD